jgi:hypothetical protein
MASGMNHPGDGTEGSDRSSGEWRKSGTGRLIQVLELMAQHKRDGRARTLCVTTAEIVGVSGASIALVSSGGVFTCLCASTDVSSRLMEFEFTGGEGPCVDVCGTNSSVDVPDLRDIDESLWPIYGPLAESVGARAVFGFPARIGAVRLGAVCLYNENAGPLTEVQTSDAYLMASVVSRAILAMQSGAPPDVIASELEQEATLDFAVHQAAGMVAVQGSMSIGDALSTLRAHAFATGSTSSALAIRIVAREASFDAATGGWKEGESPI